MRAECVYQPPAAGEKQKAAGEGGHRVWMWAHASEHTRRLEKERKASHDVDKCSYLGFEVRLRTSAPPQMKGLSASVRKHQSQRDLAAPSKSCDFIQRFALFKVSAFPSFRIIIWAEFTQRGNTNVSLKVERMEVITAAEITVITVVASLVSCATSSCGFWSAETQLYVILCVCVGGGVSFYRSHNELNLCVVQKVILEPSNSNTCLCDGAPLTVSKSAFLLKTSQFSLTGYCMV